MSSIVETMARHSLSHPDKLCLADPAKALTYKEMWECVYGLSQKLASMGIDRGSAVAVECNQSVDFVVFELAIQLNGGIFVPLEKNAARERMAEISQSVDAKLFVSKKDPNLGVPYMDINRSTDFSCFSCEDRDDSNSCGACGSCESFPPSPDDIDFPETDWTSEIMFSTGTTGKSKGVEISHGNCIGVAENVKHGTCMGPDNVELIPMPISHSYGIRRTYGNLLNGSSVVFIDGVIMIKRMFDLIDRYGVTAIAMAPAILSIIFKLSGDQIGDYKNQLDYIQLGSAPLPEEDKLRLAKLLPHTRLYNFYGSTESGCACLLDFNKTPGKPGCIGKPAVNAHFAVFDENRDPVEDSSPENLGLLASSGSMNMKGYWKEPELTKETMDDNYIYTKDLGYIDEDGYVYMLGRKDDVINYGGVKVAPEEIETSVRKSPLVRDCACVPIDDPLTGQAPKLFISLEDGASYDARQFKKFLSEVLDASKLPKAVEVIDEIPRTYNGKIQRAKLTGNYK